MIISENGECSDLNVEYLCVCDDASFNQCYNKKETQSPVRVCSANCVFD